MERNRDYTEKNRNTNEIKGSRIRSLYKVIVLQLPLIGLLFDVAVYGWFWINQYYEPKIRYNLKFYFRGHILILLIYLVLLSFFMFTYGGLKVGYLKPLDVGLSQFFSLVLVNGITYLQLSLMANWLARVRPVFVMTAVQLLISIFWILFCDRAYKRAFPPRKLLLIHGDKPIRSILDKFASRSDKYQISKCMDLGQGMEKVEQEILKGCEGVVLWDIPTADRNRLIKFCFGHTVRMYIMPKIPDVLMRGSTQLHLFDTPLFMTREYALTFGQRFWKRAIDLVCAVLLLLITSPIFLVTAIVIYAYDRGPVFYRQVRCTMNCRDFEIIKFRSMKVNAEKDGVARLAKQNDDRITPIGHFIRKVRIDELPQLINIIKGEMSFIGPRPERPEIIAQYVEEMPEFVYRMKVNAGLAGYAQIYGKYNTQPYDKLKLDLTYIQNYSVWLDLKLMLLTLKILLQPESTEGVSAEQTTALSENEETAEREQG